MICQQLKITPHHPCTPYYPSPMHTLPPSLLSPLYPTWDQWQTLVITLATPIGGCTLGTWQSVTVTILKNADYNGLFSFTSDSLLVSY